MTIAPVVLINKLEKKVCQAQYRTTLFFSTDSWQPEVILYVEDDHLLTWGFAHLADLLHFAELPVAVQQAMYQELMDPANLK